MRRGFTLIEVLVALAILALAVVYLLTIRNEAIETAGDALDVRRLDMLARWKMEEILSGKERGTGGSFKDDDVGRDYEDFRWSVSRNPVTVRGARENTETGEKSGAQEVRATQVKITVTSPSGRELVLVGYEYEEAKRGGDENEDTSADSGSGGGQVPVTESEGDDR
ncbi:MAG: prepilin-type N-terminal cleavage/methylation domain-containing protein [Planctomycetes bacterium]|nr:prepilin-type N-terminal cleavage/methylation domain-containing protein [Planctomycetota bacterium]